MDASIINPFISGLSDVLQNMTDLSFDVKKVHLKKSADGQRSVTGYIDLSNNLSKGTLAICFDDDVILDIYQRMLGEIATQLDEEVCDCVGEITNMVCGTAKALLAEKGYQFELATPTVILGNEKLIPHIEAQPVVVIPFVAESGNFHIEVTLMPQALNS